MNAQLNRDEQARVDYVAELEQHRRDGTKYVNDHQLAEAKKVADLARLNAELRAQRLAGLEQARQARAAAAEAAQQAQVEAEIDVFKQQARRAFPGTVAEFEAQWPDILRQWQQQQTLAALNAAPTSRERWL